MRSLYKAAVAGELASENYQRENLQYCEFCFLSIQRTSYRMHVL